MYNYPSSVNVDTYGRITSITAGTIYPVYVGVTTTNSSGQATFTHNLNTNAYYPIFTISNTTNTLNRGQMTTVHSLSNTTVVAQVWEGLSLVAGGNTIKTSTTVGITVYCVIMM